MTPNRTTDETYPPLSPAAIAALEAAGCHAEDWSRVRIHPGSDLSLLRDVEFEGDVTVGLLDATRFPGCRLRNVLLTDSSLGDGVRVRYVTGGIRNACIGNEAIIENCASISYDDSPACGLGMRVAVLDETGSREVTAYPGLSAQTAMVMARGKRSDAIRLTETIDTLIDSGEISIEPGIAPRARLTSCGPIHNVAVGHDVTVDAVRSLRDGAIVNNAPAGQSLAFAGPGVDAEGFIIEDATVTSGALLRNCYVGQGAKIEKGFTAHDSLFFANCAMENGEACALFAGPYSVSMHKGTLLIGCQTSFMNAGSSTNQSNHMYKLGPVHWGVLERGVKTSSGSYLMLGARIGAFSLLMGLHKTHPDSTEFPFSYLFGDEKGATVVVPGVMLRSCGLLRDEKKWPARDCRLKCSVPLHDRVICDVLNPVTVDAMIRALDTIRPMLSRPADDDRYHRYKGMKLSRASLERAMKLYYLGILKYLHRFLPDDADDDSSPLFTPIADPETFHPEDASEWVDLAGLPMPRPMLEQALHAGSIAGMEDIFDHAYRDYRSLQTQWIDARFPPRLRLSAAEIRRGAGEFDRLVDIDRETYRDSLSAETAMLRL